MACSARVGIGAVDSIDSKTSRVRDLLGVGKCLLRNRNLLHHVLGVVTAVLRISVPQTCDGYSSDSVSDCIVSKLAHHRVQQGGIEFACLGQC